MDEPAVRSVIGALHGAGAPVRFIGGCVRDALLGRPVADIDMATPLPPDTVIATLTAARLRAVPTGVAHGTVTAVVRGSTGPARHFEITTLRRDVETDGRHAVVAFTDDWRADAARRDFTMNALSARPDGALFDYFGGLADARAGRVRFIGDAHRRIREDYLRILRYFRFFAHYGRMPAEASALAACRDLAPGTAILSGERVRAELLRLLAAPDPVPAWRLMQETGVADQVIGQSGRVERLAALVRQDESGMVTGPDAVLRLAALLDGDAPAVATRLRLSGEERDRLVALSGGTDAVPLPPDPAAVQEAIYRSGAERIADRLRLAWAAAPGESRYPPLLALARSWVPPAFPLRGADIVARGIPPGPRVGALLTAIEAWWIAGDFRASRQDCLAELERRLAEPA